ncbi:hypothetical protein [Streptomyces arenae]|uniref:hypothetical protein n=1 Tax=Streptomyces arenae TaxID=29301 RepID=UPI002658EBA1|nr:hypothetical protein [Streptomyces arenae]MCG7202711.1 hypothetical protein [Streptomyces arenae]
MSEITAQTSELTSQYSAQVAGDLENNRKEQQRITAEIEALQEQLAAVRHDHTVLVNLQEALGVPGAPSEPAAAEPVTSVPAPRKKTASTKAARAAKQTTSDKPAAVKKKQTGRKAAAAKPEPRPAGTKLVDLVREHLAAQIEPRSAAEITTALAQQHPERAAKTTVVRNALEGLVAKNQAQRTKQGTSVFYTAAETAAPAAGEQTPQQPA